MGELRLRYLEQMSDAHRLLWENEESDLTKEN